ncbi:DUF2867 domain-containing protein [Marinomonas sp. THO17]|uniref:DUF2867 domain-containing protein n=1 Tax=Marinomonas sp. THO17 TaxID=3149048 RepID=UPI00336BBA87
MEIPSSARIKQWLENAYFADNVTHYTINKGQTAMQVWLEMVNRTPSWIDRFMMIRNRLATLFGLKNVGLFSDIIVAKQACDYLTGDRVGIFYVFFNNEKEVILEDKDKHLDIKLSLFLQPEGDLLKLYVTTVVHVKNRLGKVCMFLAAPVHKKILPASLAQLDAMD